MKENIKNLLSNILLLIFSTVLAIIIPILDILAALGAIIMLIAYVITHMFDPLTDKDYEWKWKILREALEKK